MVGVVGSSPIVPTNTDGDDHAIPNLDDSLSGLDLERENFMFHPEKSAARPHFFFARTARVYTQTDKVTIMPVITLPDGSQRQFDQPVTVGEVAASIGAGLARAALAGKV